MFESLERDFPPHESRPAQAPTALQGIRVVDFSHYLAGPLGTMILADMGADVIKVEPPGHGDEFRYFGPVPPQMPTQGGPYMWANRNKRSIGIDLKTAEGVALARRLIAHADVVCENFSAGVMARFGLDYEQLKADNPRLVYCAISAYGKEGEFSDRLGFDTIAQAESGFISMNGYADRGGVRAMSPIVDIGTGMMVGNAILGALLARERTGAGQRVDVTLFDTAVILTGFCTMQHLYSGALPVRQGNGSVDTCPTGVFGTRDQSFYMICGNDRMFQRLAIEVLMRPDLAADRRFAGREERLRNRDALIDLLRPIFLQQPWSYWSPRMRAAKIPCGEVRDLAQAVRSPESRARKLVTRIRHKAVGWLPNIRLPILYSATPMCDPIAAPAVGEHTAQVLSEVLGLDDDDIARLARSGALGVQRSND